MSASEITDPILLSHCTADAGVDSPTEIESSTIALFEEFRDPLLRYTLTFGLSLHDAEEVTQEVFLSLFRHLRLGRPRNNLRGWLFRVAHNLALKQRYANQKQFSGSDTDTFTPEMQSDPSPGPEEQLLSALRQQRLMSVVSALSETDRSCLRLRAEGLRYREIAGVLGISLGSVSASLSRSLTRLTHADGR